MKRVLLILAFAVISVMAFAQEPIKFMGIPVDGAKSVMIQKLKSKGFSYDPQYSCMHGEFNGKDVNVYIQTNKNKVSRIMVAEASLHSISEIKTEFNNLCYEFARNPKYASFDDDQTISESTDIQYEMTVNHKNFDAIFWQKPENIDSAKIASETESVIKNYLSEKGWDIQTINTEQQNEILNEVSKYFIDNYYSKRQVWFRICELDGKYYIALYYDNEYNRPHGEDL